MWVIILTTQLTIKWSNINRKFLDLLLNINGVNTVSLKHYYMKKTVIVFLGCLKFTFDRDVSTSY